MGLEAMSNSPFGPTAPVGHSGRFGTQDATQNKPLTLPRILTNAATA
jgi:hypothetical protein